MCYFYYYTQTVYVSFRSWAPSLQGMLMEGLLMCDNLRCVCICVCIAGNKEHLGGGISVRQVLGPKNIEQVVYLAFFCVSFQSTAPLRPSPLLSSHPLSLKSYYLSHILLCPLDVSLQVDFSFFGCTVEPRQCQH